MDPYKLKELSMADRMEILKDEALGAPEEMQYFKPLSDEEMVALREDMANASIQRSFLEEEERERRKAHKEKVELLQKIVGAAIKGLKTRQVEMKGLVYKLQDFDHYMIHVVDEYGNVILSRTMRPEERQLQFRINPAIDLPNQKAV